MSELLIGKLQSSPVIMRYENNPLLSAKDIPYSANLIFNTGVTKYEGKYVIIFRNDYGYEKGNNFEGTNLGIAFSNDGIKWDVRNKPFFMMEMLNKRVLCGFRTLPIQLSQERFI